jgi:hypothetical protein
LRQPVSQSCVPRRAIYGPCGDWPVGPALAFLPTGTVQLFAYGAEFGGSHAADFLKSLLMEPITSGLMAAKAPPTPIGRAVEIINLVPGLDPFNLSDADFDARLGI